MNPTFLGSLRTKEHYGRPGASGPSMPVPNALVARRVEVDTMSLVETRLFHALLFLSWDAFEHQQTPLEVSGAEIRRVMGYHGSSTNSVVHIGFERLASRTLQVCDPVNHQCRLSTPVFAEWCYCRQAGTFRWLLSPTIAAWCDINFTYARVDLAVIASLKTTAAIRLYELCCAMAQRDWPTKTIALEDLRTFLLDCELRYPKRSDFACRVLKPAMKQVTAASGFEITCDWSSSVRGRDLDLAKLLVGGKRRTSDQRWVDTTPLGPPAHREVVDCGCC